MNLVIDEGNSRIKFAIFDKESIIEVSLSDSPSILSDLNGLIGRYQIDNAILSSVTEQSNQIFHLLPIEDKILLSHLTRLPFKNDYKTPETLGTDRIALIAGAFKKFPSRNTLVIDLGTCITYDFINNDNVYLGGAISPGLEMRFKNMHLFTKKLPKIENENDEWSLIGKNTEESIKNGVLNGLIFELEGMINSYEEKFENLNIILTGGDTQLLYKKIKKTILIKPFLSLEGLNFILRHQN